MNSSIHAKNALIASAIGGILPAFTVANIWLSVAIFSRPVSVAEWLTTLIALSSIIPAVLISLADPSSRAKVAFSWVLPGVLLIVAAAGAISTLADSGAYQRELVLFIGLLAAQIWGMIFGSLAQRSYRKSDLSHSHEDGLRRGTIAG